MHNRRHPLLCVRSTDYNECVYFQLAKIMGELHGWKPSQSGKENRPKAVRRVRQESSDVLYKPHANRLRERKSPRRNPGRAARPEYLIDETTRPCTPDSGIGSLFSGSPGVSLSIIQLIEHYLLCDDIVSGLQCRGGCE